MRKMVLAVAILLSATIMFGQTQIIPNYQFQLNEHAKVKQAKTLKNSSKGAGVDNNDFENWNGGLAGFGLGQMPDGFLMITGNPNGQQSSTAQSGASAVHLESGVISNAILGWTDTLVGGTAFAGAFDGGLTQGEAYTEHLVSVSGYIRGNLLAADTALFIVQLKNGAAEEDVAFGVVKWGPDQLTEDYVAFTCDLIYEEDALVPDTIDIVMSSTCIGIFDIGTLTAGSWVEFDNFTYTVEAASDPIAVVSPNIWSAGSIVIDETAESGTYTLTNTGVGTLVVTSITDLSGTTFSTTFVAGDVSLDEGEEYEFTFDFTPIAAESYNETFTITTNGGEVIVELSGAGMEPCESITSFPYNHGFEGQDDFLCWTPMYNTDADGGLNGDNLIDPPTENTWFVCTPASFSGNGEDYIVSGDRSVAIGYTAPDFNWLVSPEIELPDGEMDLKFMLWYYLDAQYFTNFNVMVNHNSTWTSLLAYTDGSATNEYEEQVSLSLLDYAGETIQIAFVYEYTDGYQAAIDDIVIDFHTGVLDYTNSEINVYPNPTSGFITVNNAENMQIVVINILGEVVKTIENASVNQTIDLSNLSEGTYMVRVNNQVKKINLVK